MELLVFRFCSICSSEKKATNDDGKCDALVDGLDSNKKGNPSSRRNNSLAEFCIKAREHLLKYATVWIFPRSGKFLHSSDAAGCQLRQTRAIYVEDDEMHPKPSSQLIALLCRSRYAECGRNVWVVSAALLTIHAFSRGQIKSRRAQLCAFVMTAEWNVLTWMVENDPQHKDCTCSTST